MYKIQSINNKVVLQGDMCWTISKLGTVTSWRLVMNVNLTDNQLIL